MKRFLFVWLIYVSTTIAVAQTGIEKIERYTILNGLSNNSITSIFQDKRGFLWIGTEWGLNRFDGRAYKQYLTTGINGLPNLSIYNITEDKNGLLWVGTSSGICSFNPLTEKFIHYSDVAGKVFVDKQNNIWFYAAKEFCLLNPLTKKVEKFPLSFQQKETKSNQYILSFFEDSKNRFWIATSLGAKLFNRATNTFVSYHFPEQANIHLTVNNSTTFFEDSKGVLWAGTWGGGLLKLKEKENKFEQLKINYPANDGVNTIFSLQEIELNGERLLMASTVAGLVLLNPETAASGNVLAKQVIKAGKQDHELLSSYLSEIYKDKANCYWIGSNNGLHKIDVQQQFFKWISLPAAAESNRIFHTVEDFAQPTKLVYLTTQQGWWKMDLSNFSIQSFAIPEQHFDLLSNLNRYIATDKGYWFTSEKGFGFYNPQNQMVKDLTRLIEPDIQKPLRTVRTGRILKDDKGRIWLTHFRSGIKIYNPATQQVTTLLGLPNEKETLYGKTIYDFKKSNDGSIWISIDSLLYQINQQDLSFKTYPNFIATNDKQSISERCQPRILFDHQNRMLLINPRCILEFRNQQLYQLFPQKGLANILIEKIEIDNQGNFWIQTNNGFYKVSADFKKWINFTGNSGINGMADIIELFKTKDNQFFVASSGRVLHFKPTEVTVNTQPIPIVITSVKTKDTTYHFPTIQNTTVNIAYTSSIETELSALRFCNEKENRIYYKLQGWDDDWKELVNSSSIRYEQLPWGNYTLFAKAVNNAGVESTEIASFNFYVQPPLWKTWWFILICSIVLIGAIYLLYRYKLNQVVKEERLRSKIATDLHDDIGSTLSSISFYTETIKQQTAEKIPHLTPLLNRMGETSREMVGNMSDIVWAINPTNDDVKHLATRIQIHAASLCSLKNIALQFQCDEVIYHLKLSMEQRQNIFLLFKEGLNNALKYADCTEITIHLNKQNNLFVLLLKDNGKGFNVLETEDGNGLLNMQKRAKDIGGSFSISSTCNVGTTIEFSCNIT